MSEITTVGVDLAKEVIVVCAANRAGRTLFTRSFSFEGFARWAAQLPACKFGLEACSSAHYWARTLQSYGHQPRLIAPDHVKPFRLSKRSKNDRNDAQAIVLALQQPQMRFVAVKSVEAQAMLAVHTMRQGFAYERTALLNRIRGMLSEFGLWFGRSPIRLLRALPELISGEALPVNVRLMLVEAREQLGAIDSRVARCDALIAEHARRDEAAQRVQALCGVGPVTASALVSTVPCAADFRNGRQLAAWLGLVPQQWSSGGKERLGKITKRGDTYLRGLLTQGARSTLQSALRCAPERRSRLQRWITELHERAGYHRTLVAIANKHARMLWAILAHGEHYDPEAALRVRAAA